MFKIHKNKFYDALTATELIDNHRQKKHTQRDDSNTQTGQAFGN